MYKDIHFDNKAKIMLLRGVYKLFKAVSTTFSPSGSNVMMEMNYNQVQITKDGVTVARQVKVDNKLENIAIESVKEIALRTVERVGDGTTSSILLAYFLLKHGMIGNNWTDLISMPNSELNDDLFKKLDPSIFQTFTKKDLAALKKEAKFLVNLLNALTFKVNDPEIYKHVALISSNGDEEISEMIKNAMAQIGENGTIIVENTNVNETKMDITDGMLVEVGMLSNFFVNVPNKMICEFKNPYIVVSRDKIWASQQVGRVFDLIHKETLVNNTPPRPVIFVAPSITDGALDTLITNHTQGAFLCCAVEVGGTTEYLDDLIIDLNKVCGGIPVSTKFSKHLGVGSEAILIDDLGQLEYARISRTKMILVPKEEQKQSMKDHVEYLKKILDAETHTEDRNYVTERINRMSDKIATLTVGGLTKQSTSERFDRIEDAICACYAARKNGVVPGGLVTYAFLLENMKPKQIGNKGQTILYDALIDLIKLVYQEDYTNFMSLNTWENPMPTLDPSEEDYLEKVMSLCPLKNAQGIDLNTGETVNMFERGILDPTNVLIETIQNAVEISSLMLFSNCYITHSDIIDFTSVDPYEQLNNRVLAHQRKYSKEK